ncbi:hypothetical protein ACVNF4_31535 [Streptomyces sp. S6]
MGQHTDGMTTEFGTDVVQSLARALKVAVRVELKAVGTDTVLEELVAETDAGEAIAPGMRKSGSLGGLIRALATGGRWISTDEAEDVVDDEVDAVWREALWTRRTGKPDAVELPGMTRALRAALHHALEAARAEGTLSVNRNHVARALLELPGTRAREAMTLERIDTAAALERLAARTPEEAPEPLSLRVLRMGGAFGRKSNPVTRVLGSWVSGSGANGSPVLSAVHSEALRHAARRGRDLCEPVDQLAGILALDRTLHVHGRTLPDDLKAANSAVDVLRAHGIRQDTLRAALTAAPTAPEEEAEEYTTLTPAAERATDLARLTAAEHGAPTTGTVHLLTALLDDETVTGVLGPDAGALRADLTPLLGA